MTNIDKIKDSLSILGLKDNAQRVLLYLTEHGISPVVQIASGLNLPKTSVYDALSELIEKSFVAEYNEGKSKQFGIIDPAGIEKISDERIKEIKSAQETFVTYMRSAKKIKSTSRPTTKFYIGSEGIRQAFRDTMWHSGCRESFLMWPTREMVDVLGSEFSAWHSNQRLKHKVHLYIIRKHSDIGMETDSSQSLKTLYTSEGWVTDHTVRTAPKHIRWDMSFWIYDDKCLFASGGSERFALIVQSREFAETMKTLWRQMWNVSTPVVEHSSPKKNSANKPIQNKKR